MWSKILAVASALLVVLTSTPSVLAQDASTPQTSGGIAGTSVFPSLEGTAPGGVTGFGTVAAPGTTIQNGVAGQNGVSGSTSPGTTTFGSTTPGATNGTVGTGGTGTGGGAAGIPGGGGSCIDAIFGVIC